MDWIKLEKLLSFLLRHSPETLNLNMDASGWVETDALVKAVKFKEPKFDLKFLQKIVKDSQKQRFSFSEDGSKIRANQGHSVKVDLQLSPADPPETLYHGTVERFLDSIMQEGLKKGDRQHVHLSLDLQTAEKVGTRRGKPIILTVSAREMQQDGYVFYVSDNGVWLTENVPPQYLDLQLS
ncbi:RNA 2'-phosphotransferase [Deinococcus roseus]|nr:RNA 2'-phosphotransferase [Deinococcus roseus]